MPQVGDQAAPTPGAVNATPWHEDLPNRVTAAPHEVVVDEVHRRPRHQHVQQHHQEAAEVGEERLRWNRSRRAGRRVAMTLQAITRRRRVGGRHERVRDRDELQRRRVDVHGDDGDQARAGPRQQPGARTGEQPVGGLVDGVQRSSAGEEGGDQRAERHQPHRADEDAGIGEPQRLSGTGLRGQVAGVVRDVGCPTQRVGRRRTELDQERRPGEAAEPICPSGICDQISAAMVNTPKVARKIQVNHVWNRWIQWYP